MINLVVMLISVAQLDLFFGGFFWNRSALQLLMNLDVLAHFFFGLFIRFANTFGLASGVGNCD